MFHHKSRMQRELQKWASNKLSMERDKLEFQSACGSEYQWCPIHEIVQFCVAPLGAETREECDICLVTPSDLYAQGETVGASIQDARDIWLEEREAATTMRQTCKLKGEQREEAIHDQENNERAAWARYTDTCLLMGTRARADATRNRMEETMKSQLAQKVSDTMLRQRTQADFAFCFKHWVVGDAFPWRAKTDRYNKGCFICYSMSAPPPEDSKVEIEPRACKRVDIEQHIKPDPEAQMKPRKRPQLFTPHATLPQSA